ncbi:MAG: Rrf2 family transcriptional regulator [Treponema sp.]|nr:Rrf2 family transcriptional regulator [Treponema sp.]
MKITTRGRYALRASLALARLGKSGKPVSIHTLSEQESISSVFLEQIFFRLRKAGIVESTRGPGGGFCFALPLEEITVRQIIDAAGENLDLTSCFKRHEDCKYSGTCSAHDIWDNLSGLINNYFDGITLAAILKESASKKPAEIQL